MVSNLLFICKKYSKENEFISKAIMSLKTFLNLWCHKLYSFVIFQSPLKLTLLLILLFQKLLQFLIFFIIIISSLIIVFFLIISHLYLSLNFLRFSLKISLSFPSRMIYFWYLQFTILHLIKYLINNFCVFEFLYYLFMLCHMFIHIV